MKQPGDQQADRDIFNIDNKGTITVINQPVPQRSRSESLLLQAVKQEVISRLDQSLHNAVFINLGKQAQPQQVRRPLDAEIKIGSRLPEALQAETTILEVFDRAGIDGRLLILGEPGAGKTTTMLDLAKALCDRAEQDATAFIPVLLNLSSWKDPKQTMTAWLVEELKSKYGVRKDIGTKWLADKQLLPLLDGLDEVKPEHQESCVQSINRWLESEDQPPSLAVCCRREEYETVVRGQWQAAAEEPPDETRMHLNGAILLQTLTDEQIQAYLTAANQSELWQTLRQDEALWKLIRTPLWLSITLLSYEGLSLNQWQQTTSTEQRLALLLDAYVERMLHQKLKSKAFAKPTPPSSKRLLKRLIYQAQFSWLKPPSTRQMRHWLVYLAKQLQRESQTELSLEMIQPSWLTTSLQKCFYRLSTCLVSGLTVGMITSLVCGLPFELLRLIQQSTAYTQFEPTFERACFGYLFGLTIALVVTLFGWQTRKEIINPIEILRWSQRKVRSTFLSWSSAGMNWGAVTGFLFGALVSLDYIYPGFLNSIGLSKEAYKAKPFFTNITDGYIAVICCLIIWLAVEVFLYLYIWLIKKIGSKSLYVSFKLWRKVCRILILILTLSLAFGFNNSTITGLCSWILALLLAASITSFLVGSSGALIGGLSSITFSGWSSIEPRTRISFNQSIRQSALNAGFLGVVSGTLFGVASSFVNHFTYCRTNPCGAFGLIDGLPDAFTDALSNGSLMGIIFALIPGIPCIQHLAIRFTLFRSGSIPWNYARFLDYCTERLFLQRVGGRYRFIHKSLQEHFARMGE